MSRIAFATVLVALALPTAAVALDREPVKGGADKPLGISLDKAHGKVAKVEKFNARAGTAGIKRKLNNLIAAHNELVAAHNVLATNYTNLSNAYNSTVAVINTCYLTRSITQYSGYDYEGEIGATTALDFTEPGDFATARMMVYGC